MYSRTRLASLAVLLSALPLAAQVAPEKSEKTFKVSKGLALKLWASEPLFVNPTCMDVDHLGRVWVCEAVNYRNKLHRKPKFNRPQGDRIVILEDEKGTGRATKATTFYQSLEIMAPLGIAVAKDPVGPGYKVFVCQSPDILVFEDKDGDGKADGPPKKLLTGFGGYDHDHGVHGILIGPDLKLYFSVGDTGVHGLQSSDKKGRVWRSNNTDCRAGTIWRCEMDGTKLELIAHNFRNEYEPAVDSFGTVFVSDNDDDGNFQTRICYVMPGGDYGYHPRGRGESHWHEEKPGVVPKVLRTHFGSPTGLCFYEGTLLPREYRGQLLHTDAGPRHLRCYHLTPKGASYAVEREDVVQSTDTWYRPSDVCVAPDGSVFVADWYDPGVGGHAVGDLTRGRIYRVAPEGYQGKMPKVDLQSGKGILAALGSPNLAVRYMAMGKLEGMKPGEVHLTVGSASTQGDDRALMARAMWQSAKAFNRAAARAKLHGDKRLPFVWWMDRDPRGLDDAKYRKQMLDPALHLFPGKGLTQDAQLMQLFLRISKDVFGVSPADLDASEFTKWIGNHPSPAVHREALLLMRDADPNQAMFGIYELAKKYDGKDRFYLEAIGIAVGHHDKERRAMILADFGKHFPQWNDKVANLIWELQPPKLLPMLEKRLADSSLPVEQRQRILDTLAGSAEAEVGEYLLKYLSGDVPVELRDRASQLVQANLAVKWQHLTRGKALDAAITALLAKKQTQGTALELIGAAGKTAYAGRVAEIARGKDLAPGVKRTAIATLGLLPGRASAEGLIALLSSADQETTTEAIRALGNLARSQSGKNTEALAALEKLVAEPKSTPLTREAAVTALSASPEGARWLIAAHKGGKLPAEVVNRAGQLLRASAYRDVAREAAGVFPAPGKIDPKKLPPIPVLAHRKGDAARGKRLLDESVKSNLQCLRCHTVRGVGGHVGPDLSMIGKKASRENLFESILYPSKAIAHEYETWNVETRRGQSLQGLLVEETPTHLVLRDGEGRDTRVARRNVERREKSLKSLMPDDLVGQLAEGELVDLVEYLLTLKTAALTPSTWHIVGPFDNGSGTEGLDRVFPPEKAIDLSASYPGKFGKVSWKTVRPGATGYVDLQAHYAGRSDNIVSYLSQDVVSAADQDATLKLGSDDGIKVWVNGKLVHTSRETRAAAPEQDTVPVRLRKGTNRIVLKINNGNNPHGLFFTILAEQELKPAGR